MKDITPDLNNPALILADPRGGVALQDAIEKLQRYFPHVVIHAIDRAGRLSMCFTKSPAKALDFLNDNGHKNLLCQLLNGSIPVGGAMAEEPAAAKDNLTEFPKG